MKKRFTKTGILLLAAGVLMLGFALLQLCTGPVRLEYAVCAPEVRHVELPAAGNESESILQPDTGLKPLWEAREAAMEQLGDTVRQMACAGLKTGVSFSAGVDRSAVGSLHGVDLCYLELCPREILSGRWMDNRELEAGRQLAVLDEELAFALFGSEEAIGQEIQFAGEAYKVIGVAAHSRSVGEPEQYGAYIPLRAASAQGMQLETLTMYALPSAAAGVDQSYTSVMGQLWGEGSFYNLRKQVVGATVLPRLMAFAFGMAIVLRLARLLRRLGSYFIAQLRELNRHMYLGRLLPRAVWRFGLLAICAAALLLITYGLFSFAIDPVYSFTEWVPESLVEFSAIRAVFWNLAESAARPVVVQTPSAARIALWGGFARWGTILILLSLALRRRISQD